MNRRMKRATVMVSTLAPALSADASTRSTFSPICMSAGNSQPCTQDDERRAVAPMASPVHDRVTCMTAPPPPCFAANCREQGYSEGNRHWLGRAATDVRKTPCRPRQGSATPHASAFPASARRRRPRRCGSRAVAGAGEAPHGLHDALARTPKRATGGARPAQPQGHRRTSDFAASSYCGF